MLSLLPSRLRHLALCAALALGAQLASATVLTFDDLAGTGAMPASYGGLSFVNWFHSDATDPAYLTRSGATNIYTGDFGPSPTDGNAAIVSSVPIVVDGAYFSGFSTVSFKLYRNGILVHVSDALPSDGAVGYRVTYLASGYAGAVDRIVVSGIQSYYAMDDFTFHASAVPEVSAAALWLVGLGGVGVVTRRRRPRA